MKDTNIENDSKLKSIITEVLTCINKGEEIPYETQEYLKANELLTLLQGEQDES